MTKIWTDPKPQKRFMRARRTQEEHRHRLRNWGEATFPVSCLVAKGGGMVVFCAGASGFSITLDARYVWMRRSAFRARISRI
jgi:hypothetical protein